MKNPLVWILFIKNPAVHLKSVLQIFESSTQKFLKLENGYDVHSKDEICLADGFLVCLHDVITHDALALYHVEDPAQ